MLFKINENSLNKYSSDWNPPELELEKYLITHEEGNVHFLEKSIFGEELLLISNQVRTSTNKRADLLALDKLGNAVIIELKRDKGFLGVETQALQYLADFSKFKGKNFIKQFSRSEDIEKNILSFMGGSATIEDVNKNSRIILVARNFDSTLFSMGEWLSDKGISFRCITYSPVEIENQKFLSFSIAFDRSSESLFPISFNQIAREPSIFWHNIGRPNNDWWHFLRDEGQIPACFDDEPGDQGEQILKSYISGDKIVAYVTGKGAIGWGIIEKPDTYKLVPENSDGDKLGGCCLHRLSIKWKATGYNLDDSLSATLIRDNFGIYHPLRTSVSIDRTKGEVLIKKLTEKFKN